MHATETGTVVDASPPRHRHPPGRPVAHHLLTAWGVGPTRRRPADVAVAVAVGAALVVATALASAPAVDEAGAAGAVELLLDWLGPLWQVVEAAAVVATLGLVVAAALARRAALVRDQVLTLAVVAVSVVLLSRVASDAWPAWGELLGTAEGPHYPARNVAVLTAVGAASRPQLVRPARRLAAGLVVEIGRASCRERVFGYV